MSDDQDSQNVNIIIYRIKMTLSKKGFIRKNLVKKFNVGLNMNAINMIISSENIFKLCKTMVLKGIQKYSCL
jgi:hypothetical protein